MSVGVVKKLIVCSFSIFIIGISIFGGWRSGNVFRGVDTGLKTRVVVEIGVFFVRIDDFKLVFVSLASSSGFFAAFEHPHADSEAEEEECKEVPVSVV